MQQWTRTTLLGLLIMVGNAVSVQTQQTAFTNAHIVDPVARTIIEGAIIVQDGRIASVERSLPSSFAGERIDLGGRWVMPGLVDMHTHSFGNSPAAGMPQFLGPAGTAKLDLHAGVIAFLDLFSPEDQIFDVRNRQRSGAPGLEGAAIFAAGPCLTATNGHCSEYGVPTRIVDSPEDALREIDELAPKQPDVVKVVYDNARYGERSMPTVDRATLEAVVSNATRHGFKTIVHVGTWEDARHAALAGAAAITHTPAGAPPDDLIRIMVERSVAHIPTLAVQSDLARIVDDPSILDDPLLAAVTTDALRESYRAVPDTAARLRGFLAWQRSMSDANQAAVRQLANAGVTMLAGTDGGNSGVFQGWSVHRELELLVNAGLSTWDAVRAGTTNAAAFLEHPWGVAVGDEATFVVLDASPIDDIRNTRRIHSVVQRGKVVDRAALITR